MSLPGSELTRSLLVLVERLSGEILMCQPLTSTGVEPAVVHEGDWFLASQGGARSTEDDAFPVGDTRVTNGTSAFESKPSSYDNRWSGPLLLPAKGRRENHGGHEVHLGVSRGGEIAQRKRPIEQSLGLRWDHPVKKEDGISVCVEAMGRNAEIALRVFLELGIVSANSEFDGTFGVTRPSRRVV